MKVTEEQFKSYIELFISTLKSTAQDYLDVNLHNDLLHLSMLPAEIVGYVSTNYGIALEYTPSKTTRISINRGSARVEDLLMKAPPKLKKSGTFVRVLGRDTGFFGCSFSDAFPFRLEGNQASVILGDVTIKAGSWSRNVFYAEIYSNRSSDYWSNEKAISRAKDEVLVAIVEINRAKQRNIPISEYIDNFKEQTILLLGDYDQQGLERLQQISDVLIELGYNPIMIKDVPDHPYQDLTQKVVAVGAVARFIVIDDSSRSGHLLEVQLCKQNNWVSVLLRCNDKGGTWMTAGASHFSKVILEKAYFQDSIKKDIQDATIRAEENLELLKTKFDNTYPWRGTSS